eukprot:gene9456-1662_t
MGNSKSPQQKQKKLLELIQDDKLCLTNEIMKQHSLEPTDIGEILKEIDVSIPNLKRLMLISINMNDEACDTLAQTFENNSAIETIFLKYNSISKNGWKLLISGFKKNSTINSIVVYNNEIDEENSRV